MPDSLTALREAELFVTVEQMLTEVLGRIRPADHDLLLPPMPDLPGPAAGSRLVTVVARFVADEAAVPDLLAGRATGSRSPVVSGADAQAAVVEVVAAAVDAARAAPDAAAPVHAAYGTVTTAQYLLRLAVTRSLLAHYVAAYLGSTACPLPEQLAHDLLTATAADLASWRAAGIFREPLAVPDLASRRDTFLLTAGHLPHPLGH